MQLGLRLADWFGLQPNRSAFYFQRKPILTREEKCQALLTGLLPFVWPLFQACFPAVFGLFPSGLQLTRQDPSQPFSRNSNRQSARGFYHFRQS
jgi:hypothetical protein